MTRTELASALGKLAKGVPKNYSLEERKKRAERIIKYRREYAIRQNQQNVK